MDKDMVAWKQHEMRLNDRSSPVRLSSFSFSGKQMLGHFDSYSSITLASLCKHIASSLTQIT